MKVNDPPIIRWYVATIIFRCTINGTDGNPYSGRPRDIPAVRREVMLLRSHGPDAAHDLAVERARYRAQSAFCGSILPSGEAVAWEFAGLEDLQELPNRETLDGVVVWSRSVNGLLASRLVYPKEDLSLFCPERSWISSVADSHVTDEQNPNGAPR